MSEQERDEKLGGEIALGLVLLGGVCAFPLALLADRYSRKLLLVVILAFSSVATLGTAFTTGFTTLFWCRSLTGIAQCGNQPVRQAGLEVLFTILAASTQRESAWRPRTRRLRLTHPNV